MEQTNRKLIGEGYFAEVFEYDNNNVLKLFKNIYDEDSIKNIAEIEFNISKYAYDNDVKTPEPKEIIQENNRIGIIYQKINGEKLEKIQNLKNMNEIIIKMAELQYGINKIDYENSNYSYKKYFEHMIMICEYLSEKEKELMKGEINKLPDGNKLCHSDFRLENIILSDNEYCILDWGCGAQGTMAYDIAKTRMLMKICYDTGKRSIFKIIYDKIYKNKFAYTYVEKYCKISGMNKNDLNIYKLPLYIEQLYFDQNEKNKGKILKKLRKEIKKCQLQPERYAK